jgi:hypothetical protein
VLSIKYIVRSSRIKLLQLNPLLAGLVIVTAVQVVRPVIVIRASSAENNPTPATKSCVGEYWVIERGGTPTRVPKNTNTGVPWFTLTYVPETAALEKKNVSK